MLERTVHQIQIFTRGQSGTKKQKKKTNTNSNGNMQMKACNVYAAFISLAIHTLLKKEKKKIFCPSAHLHVNQNYLSISITTIHLKSTFDELKKKNIH